MLTQLIGNQINKLAFTVLYRFDSTQGAYQGLKMSWINFSIFKALKCLNFGLFSLFDVLKGLKKRLG